MSSGQRDDDGTPGGQGGRVGSDADDATGDVPATGTRTPIGCDHSPTPAVETLDLTIPGETEIAIIGDSHSNRMFWTSAMRAVRDASATKTIVSLGDFSFWPGDSGAQWLKFVDAVEQELGIERVLVVGGNHEDWPRLLTRLRRNPGHAVQLSSSVWVLPRPARFILSDRSFTAVPGAASIDFEDRVRGRNWWPEELPTEAEIDAAIGAGRSDVFLSHEGINDGVAIVQRVLRSNPQGWGKTALAYSGISRRRVTRAYEGIRPEVAFHGHFHIAGERTYDDGRRLYSVAAHDSAHSAGILNLESLRWTWVLVSDGRR